MTSAKMKVSSNHRIHIKGSVKKALCSIKPVANIKLFGTKLLSILSDLV